MTKRTTSNVFAPTLGLLTALGQPHVSVVMNGPRGGRAGTGDFTPAGARQLAYDLLMAADEVESADHLLRYRGYVIVPTKDDQCVDWIYADQFDVGYEESLEPINDTPFNCLGNAKAFVDQEILKCQN